MRKRLKRRKYKRTESEIFLNKTNYFIKLKQETQNELSAIAYEWLTNRGNKINKDYCRQEITTHPDYPALTSLTDFLESGGMAYDAVQADPSYIHQFNYPLLAHIKKPANEYLHLINDPSMWDREKAITQSWSGIALYATKGATWHNKENDAVEKAMQKNKYIAAAFVIAGVALFIASLFIYPNSAINIFGLLSLAGLAISIAALGTELGYQSKIVKQVCGTVGNGGCEKELGSKFAKGFAGITPADASLLYFTAQFILYLLGCFYNSEFSGILNVAFTGIVIAGWSIFTQAVKVKEWCAICLSIVSVLLGQIIISIIEYNTSHLLIIDPYVFLVITIGLLAAIYFPIKYLLRINLKNGRELISFEKWKKDASLFIAQWKTQPECNNEIWENDIIVGNAEAPIRITVACNPFCTPCAKAHFTLDNLLEKYPEKICIQIRILCISEDKNNPATIAAQYILQAARYIKDNNTTKQMLSEWFNLMNLEKWQIKWQINKQGTDVVDDLKNHDRWIRDSNIKFTPTFFLNGKMLPNRYDLKSLEKLIPQLEGILDKKI